jgi:hypothetical protein
LNSFRASWIIRTAIQSRIGKPSSSLIVLNIKN